MTEKIDYEKAIEESILYRENILKSLLVSSITEDNSRFPTIEEFILSEVANGTIEYVGGNSRQVNYQQFEVGFDRNAFERNLWICFETEMKLHSKGKLNPKIRTAINKMVQYHMELYTFFNGGREGICPVTKNSTFSLPYEIVVKVQKEVLPSLSNPERRDIEGIGKLMRQYINEDLDFIRKTYQW